MAAVSIVEAKVMWSDARHAGDTWPAELVLTSRFPRNGNADGRAAFGAMLSAIKYPSGFRRRAGIKELLQGLD